MTEKELFDGGKYHFLNLLIFCMSLSNVSFKPLYLTLIIVTINIFPQHYLFQLYHHDWSSCICSAVLDQWQQYPDDTVISLCICGEEIESFYIVNS